jgi:competence ComEA-like helix-hairpin-helix protein
MGKRAAGQNPGLEAVQSLGFLVGSCAGLILSLAFATGASHRAAGSPAPRPGGRINPNDASVASLARLPGIGLTRARAIVAFRDHLQDRQGRAPAFRRAEDLAQVKGIGPATVEGMRLWLQFAPLPGDSHEPVAR